MKPELKARFKELSDTHVHLYEQIVSTRNAIEQTAQDELCDAAIMFREAMNLAEDMRKECRQIGDLIAKAVCARWVMENVNDPDGAESIRTEYVTASPNVKTMAALPNRKNEPELYKALMERMGVTGTALDDGLCTFYWPKFVDHISDLIESGKPLPPELKGRRTYDIFKLDMRKKKSLLDEE